MHEDRHRQDRLKDWNDFRAFYYNYKLRPQLRRVPYWEKRFRDIQKALEDIVPGLGGTPPLHPIGRMERIMWMQQEERRCRGKGEYGGMEAAPSAIPDLS